MQGQKQVTELETVFITNRQQLKGIAQKIVGTQDRAEDVLQDVYIRLLKCSFNREIDKPFSYCCQVVRNISIDYCRKQKVEAGYRDCSDDQKEVLDNLSTGCTTERVIAQKQLLNEIIKVVDGLPERIRLVFELHRLEGFTQRQIAQQVGCSAALVNIMLKEAMQAIAKCHKFDD
ncbi:sigma-70 family RNA polymerase sigma factor [Pseudoalteromonas prydzensis]|uniref:Sigma-70 family RNA polymerase sigma factor n=1 Tax=Pseudoalteromonas prydzensis TaxID=182141 RepID=A0ABR9FJQ4_9GAMM|nr:sigma-70 family RNA polymerase sigma factor [Pseudoalteromonas prydzensis]MBE0457046.1 sigma-70 family RNA polymerase sigma factor [Pseudoalteromonas prydzensis]